MIDPNASLKASLSLAGQVAATIGTAIISGEIQGSFTEQELEDRYGISRSVTRDTVKTLLGKGLVRSRQRVGIQVTHESQWNWFDEDVLSWALAGGNHKKVLRDILQLRLVVEPEAASMLATYRDNERSVIIDSYLSKLDELISQHKYLKQAEMLVHLAIVESVPNRFFKNFSSVIKLSMELTRGSYLTEDAEQEIRSNAEDLHQIVVSIKNAQPMEARLSMRRLLEKELRSVMIATAPSAKNT